MIAFRKAFYIFVFSFLFFYTVESKEFYYPKIYNSFWPNFCLEHLVENSEECSEVFEEKLISPLYPKCENEEEWQFTSFTGKFMKEEKHTIDLGHLYLSLQGALLGSVVPEMRAVTIDLDEKERMLYFAFFYDAEVTEDLEELASCIVTETDNGSIFPCHYLSDFKAIEWRYPEQVPIVGKCVYHRKEDRDRLPFFDPKKRGSSLLLPPRPFLSIFKLEMQEALLGKVVPELRTVALDMDKEEKELTVYFIYEEPFQEEYAKLTEEIFVEATTLFPLISKKVHLIFSVEEDPFSLLAKKGYSEKGWPVYLRYEKDWLGMKR